uniref:Nuclear receptor n=2 Tax=Meloidogyne TaxID=189290 RepID=A0A915NK55_9BILA
MFDNDIFHGKSFKIKKKILNLILCKVLAVFMAHKDAVGLCLICGELSFGKHYGCLSCLGCKTFFRRAVMHGQDTICKKPNICEQEVCARRLCRSCRFRRCLDMGMSREALQPRRDLIGRRKKRPTQIQFYQNNCVSTIPSTSGSEVTPSPTNHLLTPQTDILYSSISDGNNNLLDLISSLAATDKAIRARKFELIRARTEAKRLADVASKGSRVVQQHDTLMKIVLCSDLCNVTQIEMFSMLEWVQTIPAFSSLHLPDKMLLLKRFAMPCNVIEYGYFTAQIGLDDVWLISNGTCMPRSVNVLPDESKTLVTEDRKWRQEKLYKQMTDRCIDGLVIPLRRLQLTPEELVTLKILLLFSCGNHTQKEEATSFISDESRKIALEWKNKVIAALFQFYRSIGHKSAAERFGNVILLISGIVSAASATLESYQIMRLFKFANFDRVSEQLLFDID